MKFIPSFLSIIFLPLYSMNTSYLRYEQPALTKAQRMILDQDQLLRPREVDRMGLYSYPIETIVRRFMKEYNVSQVEASNIEIQFKTFIFEANRNQQMPVHTKKVTQFWRIFILHTREYHLFCFTFFGRMIHYNPSISDMLEVEVEPRSREGEPLKTEVPKTGAQLLQEILYKKEY